VPAGTGGGSGSARETTTEPAAVTPPDSKETPAKTAKVEELAEALSPSAGQQLQEADAALQAEMKKPAEDRNYRGLLAKYRKIPVAEGETSLKQMIDQRINALQAMLDRIGNDKDVEELVAATKAQQLKLAADRGKIQAEDVKIAVPTMYVAEGVLTPSPLFPGGATGPKRYIVRDPQTLRINAYIQCTTQDVELADYVNKYVGIKGTTKYSKDLRLDIVDAKEVVVLADKVDMPKPPGPIVKTGEEKPRPVVAPKAPAAPPAAPPTPTTPTTRPPAPKAEPAAPAAPAAEMPSPDDAATPEAEEKGAEPEKPAPSTGLPVIEPASQPTSSPVNESEYVDQPG
jgi:hypothetical protein